MPLKLYHQAEARRDLRLIWTHTADRWGEAQADTYLSNIGDKLRILLDHPEIGPRYEEGVLAYRKLNVGQHIAFYRIDGEIIPIVRILHGKADIPSLLR